MREIPPWILIDFPLPNYVNPVTHGDALVLVNSIFLALVVLAVGLRFYTRIVIKKSFGSDDIFIGLALVSIFSPHSVSSLPLNPKPADPPLSSGT